MEKKCFLQRLPWENLASVANLRAHLNYKTDIPLGEIHHPARHSVLKWQAFLSLICLTSVLFRFNQLFFFHCHVDGSSVCIRQRNLGIAVFHLPFSSYSVHAISLRSFVQKWGGTTKNTAQESIGERSVVPEITLLHKSGGVYQKEWFKIISVHYPGLLPPIRWDSNIPWLMLKSRRMRMDACPLSTDRRVSSINATWTVPVPCPGFNPDCDRSKRFTLSRFSSGCSLARNHRKCPGIWEPSWILVRKNSFHRVDFLKARWHSISNMLVIPQLVFPIFPLSRLWPSGLGSGTILGRWQHEEARQHCQVKSRTRTSSEV